MLGFEGDFAYAPRFFERDNLAGNIFDSELMTVSGNVIASVPLAVTGYSLRPYAIGGIGLDPLQHHVSRTAGSGERQ